MLMRSYPVLSRFIIWIVLPIVILCGWGYKHLADSLPQTQGTVKLTGLKAPVKVIRDEKAIPHITAKSDYDAFFALGYVHAQDRIWQMTYTRRLVQGRLSEIMGIDTLGRDQFMRTIGLYRSAESAIEALDENALQSLEAYAKGVNAWIKEEHTLPVEFHVLDTKPELWAPADSVSIIKLMALNLSFNYEDELDLDMLVGELGIAKAKELHPNFIYDDTMLAQIEGQIDADIREGLLAQNRDLRKQHIMGVDGVGSNGWVVSGKMTESGLPLLASDPHLQVEIPSQLYLVNVEGDRLQVSGATYPGAPVVIMGRNQSIAWGTTSMMADVQDLYVERTNPLNEDQYEVDGQWLEMEVEEEFIQVKREFPEFLNHPIPPVKWEVRRTKNGPLISDVIGRVDRPLSLKWTALEEHDRTYQSYLNINYAQDWNSFKSSFEGYVAPAINFLYADVHGDIGFFAAAKIPVRKHSDGSLPVPGWKSMYEWDSYIPTDELPQVLNPEEGYFVNSNNQNHADDYPYKIASRFGLKYRSARVHEFIQENLAAGNKFSVQDFATLQGDMRSVQVRELLPFVQNLKPENQKQREAIEQFNAWEGLMAEDSKTAALFQVWLRHFNETMIGDDIPGGLLHEVRSATMQSFFVARVQIPLVMQAVEQDPSLQFDWCDRINTDEKESCEDIALIALDAAIEELDRMLWSSGEWGDLHTINYRHQVFTDRQFFDFLFDRSTPSGGERTSLNTSTWDYTEEFGYDTVVTPAYRQVVDLSDWDKSRFINLTGQSGNLLSKHYDDNILPFKDMAIWPMTFAAEQGQGQTLILSPATLN